MTLTPSQITTLRRVADGLLIVLIGVVLFGVILGRVVPMTGRGTLIVGGGSMEPAIPLGAAVVIEPVATRDLAVGDVVSLRTGRDLQRIFTHRITRIVPRTEQLWIETKGDANTEIDPSITPTSQVVGRVTWSIPYAGFLLALLSIPSGVLVVLVVAAFLIVLIWLLESFEIDGLGQPAAGNGPVVAAGQAAASASGVTTRYEDTRATRRRRSSAPPTANYQGD
jgi:signal peptidase